MPYVFVFYWSGRFGHPMVAECLLVKAFHCFQDKKSDRTSLTTALYFVSTREQHRVKSAYVVQEVGLAGAYPPMKCLESLAEMGEDR